MILLFTVSIGGKAQIDTEFWFAAPDNYQWSTTPGFYPDRPLYLRFMAYDSATTVTITQPANPLFAPIIVQVPPLGFQSVDLTPFLAMIETAPVGSVVPYGLKIVSDFPISAYFENAGLASSAIYTLKGRNALGTEFLIPQQRMFPNAGFYGLVCKNSIVVLATASNTTVKIVPSNDCEDGHLAGDTITVVLNPGEAYNVKALGLHELLHLGGSWVFADKPVAVTSHEEDIFVSLNSDHMADQLVPNDKADTSYIIIHSDYLAPWEMVYFYAPNNNTELFVGDSPTPAATLQRGGFYRLDMYDSAYYVHSTKPVLAYHLCLIDWVGGADLVPGLYCHGSRRVSVFRSYLGQPYSYTLQFKMMVVVKAGLEDGFLLNGDPTLIVPGNFRPVNGTGGEWLYALLQFPITTVPQNSVAVISNTQGSFQLGVSYGAMNLGARVGYFSSFSTVNLGPDRYLCPDDSLTLDAGYGQSNYQWNTGDTTQMITVADTGQYWVTVSTGFCSASDTIFVHYTFSVPPDLGPDRAACEGTPVVLDGGPGYTYYTWNTGQHTRFVTVTNSGNYSVEVTDLHGCLFSDSVTLQARPSPLPKLIIHN
ncbi:MAG: IgGFc-binding protein [Bacteroidales bacterium]|nr:IgGFc-binding protein [Bacteroidales bacterium]